MRRMGTRAMLIAITAAAGLFAGCAMGDSGNGWLDEELSLCSAAEPGRCGDRAYCCDESMMGAASCQGEGDYDRCQPCPNGSLNCDGNLGCEVVCNDAAPCTCEDQL